MSFQVIEKWSLYRMVSMWVQGEIHSVNPNTQRYTVSLQKNYFQPHLANFFIVTTEFNWIIHVLKQFAGLRPSGDVRV